MQFECYAQRLLNPFRGVAHTIRYQSAEAVTTDGIEWDIYVANDALLEGLGPAGRRAQISDIRYGHWSAEKDLKRGPLFPSAARVEAALMRNQPRQPQADNTMSMFYIEPKNRS